MKIRQSTQEFHAILPFTELGEQQLQTLDDSMNGVSAITRSIRMI
jgi:hypothetical protein